MAGMKLTIKAMWCIVLVAAVASAPRRASAVVSCSTVASDLMPCLSYLTSTNPIGDCCSGVKALYSAASTTPDRQSVCTCMKQLLSGTSNVDLGKAAGLPSQCGINIPYKIDPSTDCATVQ